MKKISLRWLNAADKEHYKGIGIFVDGVRHAASSVESRLLADVMSSMSKVASLPWAGGWDEGPTIMIELDTLSQWVEREYNAKKRGAFENLEKETQQQLVQACLEDELSKLRKATTGLKKSLEKRYGINEFEVAI